MCTMTNSVKNVTAKFQVTRRQNRREGTKNEYRRDVESSTNALGSKSVNWEVRSKQRVVRGVENVVVMRFIKESRRFVFLQSHY